MASKYPPNITPLKNPQKVDSPNRFLNEFRFLDIDDLEALPEQQWVIQDFFYEDSICTVYGEPGCGKSHFTLGAMYHIALGKPFLGKDTQQGTVVYTAAEGVRGYRKRHHAWMHSMEVTPDERAVLKQNLAYVPCEVKLGFEEDVRHFIEAINLTADQKFHAPPTCIVLDTLFQCAAGIDINAPGPMSQLMSTVKEIKRGTGASFILLIHHSGKDKSRGMTGNMALKGGCDIVFFMERQPETEYIKITNADGPGKIKDGEPSTHHLLLKKVTYGFGIYDSSCVVIPNEDAISTEKFVAEKKVKPPTKKDQILALLPQTGLTYSAWEDACTEAGFSASSFKNYCKDYTATEKVKKTGTTYYPVWARIDPSKDVCGRCQSSSWAYLRDVDNYTCVECNPQVLNLTK